MMDRRAATGGKPGRILVLNLTRMGDIIQSGPLIQGLRARHPGARIGLLTLRAFAAAARLLPGVDECLELDQDKAVSLLLDPERSLAERAAWFRDTVRGLRGEGWDLVVNLSHSRDSAVLAHLLGRGEQRGIAIHPDGVVKVEHDWARYFFCVTGNRAVNHFNLVDMYRLAGGLGPGEGHRLGLVEDPRAAERAAALLGALPAGPRVMIQPGASRENRRWPTERLAETMRRLHTACGSVFVLAGSRSERALCGELAAQAGDLPLLNLAGETSLAELAEASRQVDLLITNDTGTLHVAAAVGTPSVSLFFATALPWETGPWLPGCLVVQAVMECAPCSHHVVCPHVMCREAISVEVVAGAARELLARRGLSPAPDAGWELAPGTRVWETCRDAHGLQDLRPLGRPAPTAQDLLARAYRHLWRRDLGGGAGGEGSSFRRELEDWRGHWAAPASEALSVLEGMGGDLVHLEEVARTGAELAATARRELDTARPDSTRLEAVVRELPALDDRLFRLELSRPLLRPLGVLFRFEKEQLDARQELEGLGRETEEAYLRLGRRAASLRGLLAELPRCLESAPVVERSA
jgi:ADP-heptose:LPS heptosyltransferase